MNDPMAARADNCKFVKRHFFLTLEFGEGLQVMNFAVILTIVSL